MNNNNLIDKDRIKALTTDDCDLTQEQINIAQNIVKSLEYVKPVIMGCDKEKAQEIVLNHNKNNEFLKNIHKKMEITSDGWKVTEFYRGGIINV